MKCEASPFIHFFPRKFFLHFCWNYLHKKLFPPLFFAYFISLFFSFYLHAIRLSKLCCLKSLKYVSRKWKTRKKKENKLFHSYTIFFRWKYLHAIMLFKQVITFYVELSSMRGEKHDVASSWRIFMMLLCNESFVTVCCLGILSSGRKLRGIESVCLLRM